MLWNQTLSKNHHSHSCSCVLAETRYGKKAAVPALLGIYVADEQDLQHVTNLTTAGDVSLPIPIIYSFQYSNGSTLYSE